MTTRIAENPKTTLTGFSRRQMEYTDVLDDGAKGKQFAYFLQEEFEKSGYIASDQTKKLWNTLGAVEAPLDFILDGGAYENPRKVFVFNEAVDYILGYKDSFDIGSVDDRAYRMLTEARTGLSPLDELQREGIRYLARHIAIIDSQIKQTTSPFELAKLRKLEGDLEVQIFALAVPQTERVHATGFDKAVNNLRKKVGTHNLLNSAAGFEDDIGFMHKVSDERDRDIFTGLAIGSAIRSSRSLKTLRQLVTRDFT